jgi:ubiquitin carboxyl-terminal hydrolase 5/13
MDSDAVLRLIRSQFAHIKAPGPRDRVFKNESLLDFDTPFSPGGLYVSLATWAAYGERFIQAERAASGGVLYLHQKWKMAYKQPSQSAQEPSASTAPAKAEPTKLALGVEGGFALEGSDQEVVKSNRLVVFIGAPGDAAHVAFEHPSQTAALPEILTTVLDAILKHDDAQQQAEVSAVAFEFAAAAPSKFADALVQARALLYLMCQLD